jgi:hypothetical protein
LIKNAEVAQLVEHNLAKVGVAGSNPVFRSRYHPDYDPEQSDKVLGNFFVLSRQVIDCELDIIAIS